MKRKLTTLFLALALTLALVPSAFAASDEAKQAADALHDLGLFQGVGTNADGTPNYDLDRTPSREEAVTMLVRLLGKEDEAKAGAWTNSFTDVSAWAKPYVGYAYANGLTNGVNTEGTLFGGGTANTVTATQYITFALRSLGYESGKDFKWDAAWELSDKLGITDGRYNAATNKTFTRGDIAIISLATYQYGANTGDAELDRAVALGLTNSTGGNNITFKQYFQILDNLVGRLAPDKLAGYKAQYVAAHGSDEAMTRFDGMAALLTAAETLGGGYLEIQDWDHWDGLNNKMGEGVWDQINWREDLLGADTEIAFDGFAWNRSATAYFFSFGKQSLLTGADLFDYDAATNSMRVADALTYADAVRAALRLYESDESPRRAAVTDSRATTPVISSAMLAKAAGAAGKSMDDLPRLTGFVLNEDYQNEGSVTYRPRQIKTIADWGFTSVRYQTTYEMLFSPDCSTVNLTELEKLDALVEQAIRSGVHLNLSLITLPGRTTRFDTATWSSVGEFVLFVNPAKLEKAKLVWRTLAERYKDIPGTYLSFLPFWEPTNHALSSGLSAPDYDRYDVRDTLDALAGAIRAVDPDRFLLYEACAEFDMEEAVPSYEMMTKKYDNTRIQFNFCQQPFVYETMTAEEGLHIDFGGHSMFKHGYPVTIYSARYHIEADDPITLDGCLPAGTRIDIYLSESGRGTFTAADQSGAVYSEALSDKTYTTSSPLSRYYPYATSDKKLSFTLEQDAEALTLSCTDYLDWCGMDVVLPDSYAVERWYCYSPYDAWLDGAKGEYEAYEAWDFSLRKTSTVMISPYSYTEGSHITIHEDVTYSSEAVYDAANRETIEAWCAAYHSFAPQAVVRFERAFFNANTSEDTLRYYEDMLAAFDECGYDWYSNDFGLITGDYGPKDRYAGAELVPYGEYEEVDIALLQLLQKHR